MSRPYAPIRQVPPASPAALAFPAMRLVRGLRRLPGRRPRALTAGPRPSRAGERGQMAVELAALVPVVVVVALTVTNLARFVVLCARFDRVAPDMACAHGVAPAAERGDAAASGTVAAEIERAFESERAGLGSFEIVVAAGAGASASPGAGITFPVSPLLTKYTCTLRYHPWPGSFVIAGVAFASPLALEHVRTITVDRFRPGVVA